MTQKDVAGVEYWDKCWADCNYSARKYFQKTRRFSLTPFFEKTQHSYGT